jgi:hypothetical protein
MSLAPVAAEKSTKNAVAFKGWTTCFFIKPAEAGMRPDEKYQLIDDKPIKIWNLTLAKSPMEKPLNGQCQTALQSGGAGANHLSGS